jgi:hypothetical protein
MDMGATPVTRVTLRYASAADADRLRRLAALGSADPALADPLHRGAELVELLRLRVLQLS